MTPFGREPLERGGFPIEENIKLVKDLTDRGVINTICSENDEEPVITKLKEFGVFDYFVFLSINWAPKGQRISKLISDMGLRPVNCLFLDDNVVNLNEALFYSKDLMISEPDGIKELVDFTKQSPITDISHKRLNQYVILEKKQKAKEDAGDNLAFLYSSNTQVTIRLIAGKTHDIVLKKQVFMKKKICRLLYYHFAIHLPSTARPGGYFFKDKAVFM